MKKDLKAGDQSLDNGETLAKLFKAESDGMKAKEDKKTLERLEAASEKLGRNLGIPKGAGVPEDAFGIPKGVKVKFVRLDAPKTTG